MANCRQIEARRVYAVVLCFFVCLFFAHAKLSGYQPHTNIDSGSVSTLHVSGLKMETQKNGSALLPVSLLALVSLFTLVFVLLRPLGPSRIGDSRPVPAPFLESNHFFRPPPTLFSNL